MAMHGSFTDAVQAGRLSDLASHDLGLVMQECLAHVVTQRGAHAAEFGQPCGWKRESFRYAKGTQYLEWRPVCITTAIYAV